MYREFQHALRSLRKHPGPSLVAVLVLALGIGANTVVFSLVNGLLLAPLDFERPEELVRIFGSEPARNSPNQRISLAAIDSLIEASREVGTETGDAPWARVAGASNMGMAITDSERPMNPLMRRVTSGWFETLGVEPFLGRTFGAEEHAAGARVVILHYGFWQSFFGADPDVLGKTLELAYEPYEVVGVMPASFGNPSFPREPVLWLPQPESATPDLRSSSVAIARLAGPDAQERFRQIAGGVATRLVAEHGQLDDGWTLRIVPLHESYTETLRPALVLLLGAVGFVMLIACGNVANILLARSLGRRQEMAIRLAVGAGRKHLLRQLLAEGLILALGGAILGVLAAFWSLGPLLAMAPSNTTVPLLERVAIEPRVLVFSLVLAIGTTVVFALFPMTQVFRESGDLLSAGAVRSTGNRRRRDVRGALVIAEVAVSMILLVAAGLMVRTLVHLRGLELGFAPDGVLAGRIGARGPGFDTPDRWQPFHRQALDNMANLPGVTAAGGIEFLPMFAGGFGSSLPVVPEDSDGAESTIGKAALMSASIDYFAAFEQPILRGRGFEVGDTAEGEQVAVISANLAASLWGDGDPIGRGLRLGDPNGDQPTELVRVVGVAGDLRGVVRDPTPAPILFRPLAQRPVSNITVFLRTDERASDALLQSLLPSVEDSVWSISRDVPVYSFTTVDQVLRDLEWQPRFVMQLLLGFAILALLLAASGTYAVIAFAVAERSKEIGIRMSVGADRLQISLLVLTRALILGGAGVILGTLGALATSRLISSQLRGVASHDPLTYGVLSAILLVVVLLASALPALRASRVDPVRALEGD